MTAVQDLAAAVRQLAAAVRDMSEAPEDQARLLAALAEYHPAEATAPDTVGRAMAQMQDAAAALCRRSAVIALARVVPRIAPPSYDAAVALRERVCGLLDAEILIAGDMGDDASGAALRRLRTLVAEDLTERAANLARLRVVEHQAPLPALVVAYRLYRDIDRAPALSLSAEAADPNALPVRFRALER